ncbi:hypothetical protein [Vibrio aerogenes]|uniref:hypothetical protein n=1 Tax=Vibrio aerogenes TaxID=92172 RepID=UPI0021C3495C|nr:hypothetical protein [Vibrio aerogenes]
MKIKLLNLAIGFSLSTLLVGCGSDDNKGNTDSSGIDNIYKVTAIDGYLNGARVWLDVNGNYQFDADEPSAITGNNGQAEINVNGVEHPENYSLMVQSIKGQTVDEDLGQAVAVDYVLSAPAGTPYISPLTTVVQLNLAAGKSNSTEEAVNTLASNLGIDPAQILSDYIQQADNKSAFAARSLVSTGSMPESTEALQTILSDSEKTDEFLNNAEEMSTAIKNEIAKHADDSELDAIVMNTSGQADVDSDGNGIADSDDAVNDSSDSSDSATQDQDTDQSGTTDSEDTSDNSDSTSQDQGTDQSDAGDASDTSDTDSSGSNSGSSSSSSHSGSTSSGSSSSGSTSHSSHSSGSSSSGSSSSSSSSSSSTSSDSSADSTSETVYEITAIDGYLNGAQAWLDINGNNEFDADEPNALTDNDGHAELNVEDVEHPEQYSVIVKSKKGETVDADLGQAVAIDYILSAPAGTQYISPLTTLVHMNVKAGKSETTEAAVDTLANQLGIDASHVLGDYIQSEDKKSAFAARNLVSTGVMPESTEELQDILSDSDKTDAFLNRAEELSTAIKNEIAKHSDDSELDAIVMNSSGQADTDSDGNGIADTDDAANSDNSDNGSNAGTDTSDDSSATGNTETPDDSSATGNTETPDDSSATGNTETPDDSSATGNTETPDDSSATGNTETPDDSSATGNTETPDDSSATGNTETPDDSSATGNTETPDDSSATGNTETPDDSATGNTETPDDSSATGNTETPDDSSATGNTETPDDSSATGNTETPDDSSATGNTETPDDSSATGNTETPDDSSATGNTETPDDSSATGNTETPDDSSATGNTETPDDSSATGNTETPDDSSATGNTETPDDSSATGNTETPDDSSATGSDSADSESTGE